MPSPNALDKIFGNTSAAAPNDTRGVASVDVGVVDTLPWYQTDGSMTYIGAADLPEAGFGFWSYWLRSGEPNPFVLALAPGAFGTVVVFLVKMPDGIEARLPAGVCDTHRDEYGRIPIALNPPPRSVGEAMTRIIGLLETTFGIDATEVPQ